MHELRSRRTDTIAQNLVAETAPTEEARVAVGDSAVAVRHRGAFITQGRLVSKSSGSPVDVFYSDSDPTTPKLAASHFMSPAGPHSGVGGQHGFARWSDYTAHASNLSESSAGIILEAQHNGATSIQRALVLTENQLAIKSTIFANEMAPHETSIGEHFYFGLAGERFDGLTINGNTLDELLGEGTEAAVIEGTPFFWPDYEGDALVHFPAGHDIRLSARYRKDRVPQPVDQLGMLVWHKPGSESVCLEPVAGLGAGGLAENATLALMHGSSLTLETKVELL